MCSTEHSEKEHCDVFSTLLLSSSWRKCVQCWRNRHLLGIAALLGTAVQVNEAEEMHQELQQHCQDRVEVEDVWQRALLGQRLQRLGAKTKQG